MESIKFLWFLYYSSMCVCVCVCPRARACTMAHTHRGQKTVPGIISISVPCGSWGLNPGCWAWWQTLLPAETSCQLKRNVFIKIKYMHLPFLTLEKTSALPALTQLPKVGDSVGSLLFFPSNPPSWWKQKDGSSHLFPRVDIESTCILHCSLSPQTRTTEAESYH